MAGREVSDAERVINVTEGGLEGYGGSLAWWAQEDKVKGMQASKDFSLKLAVGQVVRRVDGEVEALDGVPTRAEDNGEVVLGWGVAEEDEDIERSLMRPRRTRGDKAREECRGDGRDGEVGE